MANDTNQGWREDLALRIAECISEADKRDLHCVAAHLDMATHALGLRYEASGGSPPRDFGAAFEP